MRRHVVAPATVEQIERTLGVTDEDREIVRSVLGELFGGSNDPRSAGTKTGKSIQPSPPSLKGRSK